MSFLLILAAATPALSLINHSNEGRLPTLGWSSWNAYHCDINADKVLATANSFVSLGLRSAGYNYVNIDDCWSDNNGRDSNGRILPDFGKFPKGINGLADQIHSMNLKLGIYSSAGYSTCANYPASLGKEDIDAQTFAAWGIDFLKYDNCGVPSEWQDSCEACIQPFIDGANGTCSGRNDNICPSGTDYTKSKSAQRYQAMRDALLRQNRTIVYNVCEWGRSGTAIWGNVTANSWRTTPDIDPYWGSISRMLNINSFRTNYGDFWGHNDPDMLEVGNGDLTDAECRTHFALWALMKAPLIIGTDLSKISATNLKTLLNPNLLAFNQDPVIGRAAAPYRWGYNPNWTWDDDHPAEFWAGPSSSRGTFVAIINTQNYAHTMSTNLKEIPGLDPNKAYRVTDAWNNNDVGCITGGLDVYIDVHDTAVFMFKQGC